MAWLGSIPVYPSELVPVGHLIRFDDRLVAHPLDVIAFTERDALRRLDAAMAWILDAALRRLDVAERRLS